MQILSFIVQVEGIVPVEGVLFLGHNGCTTGLNVHLPLSQKKTKNCLKFHAVHLFFHEGGEHGVKANHNVKSEPKVA